MAILSLSSTAMPVANIISPDLSGDGVGSKRSFKEMLGNALSNVNNQQLKADRMSQEFAVGKSDNVHELMITLTEAKLALDLTIQVRNRAVEAYQEIMRMQV